MANVRWVRYVEDGGRNVHGDLHDISGWLVGFVGLRLCMLWVVLKVGSYVLGL